MALTHNGGQRSNGKPAQREVVAIVTLHGDPGQVMHLVGGWLDAQERADTAVLGKRERLYFAPLTAPIMGGMPSAGDWRLYDRNVIGHVLVGRVPMPSGGRGAEPGEEE